MDIVLGAGIAGLGAFYHKEQLEIYESGSSAGGLCGGFEIDGFHFDQAVHLSFTGNETVRRVFDRTPYYAHHPVPYSWFRSRYLQHPAQNNLYPLPAEEKVKAVKGFLERTPMPEADNFRDWNRSRYGDWLYENLFRPYNEKYWCTPLEELGTDWIGNRIYQPSLEEVLYGSYSSRTPNTYYAKEMRYPRQGGYFSFLSGIAGKAEKAAKIHYGKKAVRILPDRRTVVFGDGSRAEYENLYSSVPLTEMVEITEGMPEELKKLGQELEYTGVALVSAGLKKTMPDDKMWFYIYDRDILAARAYLPSVKSPDNAPEGCASIQFEIYFNGKEKEPEKAVCMENCIYAMKKLGIAEEEEILFLDYRLVPYGNIIFKKGTKERAEKIRNYLEANGIVPIGRFGRWEYLWSDQAFLSGYTAVEG